MFQHRRTGQKPGGDMISEFQHKFANVVGPTPSNTDTSTDFKPDESASQQQQGPRPPGQFCTVLHSPAGDLHTPTLQWSVDNAPQYWQTGVDSTIHNTASGIQWDPFWNPSDCIFHNMLPFTPGPAFAPSTFRPVGYEGVPGADAQLPTPISRETSQQMDINSSPDSALRYCVTLHAPTATLEYPKQTPLTYLNRRQGYCISIADTAPPRAPLAANVHVRYRSSIRIAFDDASQRTDAVRTWKLWRDNRGLREAFERGTSLLAVEFLCPKEGWLQNKQHTQVVLEKASFDGFCITWSGNAEAGRSQCAIHVAFHFLSTDFSFAKGVRGVPLRLCAKTQVVASDWVAQGQLDAEPELSYCRVKVFRDHGAERKLASDQLQIRNAIQRVERQIEQAENKSLRGNHAASMTVNNKKGHAHRAASRDELRAVLQTLKDAASSARPTTVFSLQGEKDDDPDVHPVELPDISRDWMQSKLQKAKQPGIPATAIRESQNDARSKQAQDGESEAMAGTMPGSSVSGGRSQAVACVYILFRDQGTGSTEEYYRAVYLMERTVQALKTHISEMHSIPSDQIVRLVRLTKKGLRIVIDDDVVREIPEGQDMIAEVLEIPGEGVKACFEVLLSY